jgi:hypothetical protein
MMTPWTWNWAADSRKLLLSSEDSVSFGDRFEYLHISFIRELSRALCVWDITLQIHHLEHDKHLPDETIPLNQGATIGWSFEQWKAPHPFSPSSIFNSNVQANSLVVWASSSDATDSLCLNHIWLWSHISWLVASERETSDQVKWQPAEVS